MKYAPRKVYIKENNVYVELSYKDFCRRRKADQSYMDKLFIPVQSLTSLLMKQWTLRKFSYTDRTCPRRA